MPQVLRRYLSTNPPRPGLLLVGQLQHCQPEWNALKSKYNLLQFQGDRQQFLKNCESGAFDKVLGLYRTNSIAETGNFDSPLVSMLPCTLKYIGHNGAGYDNIDVQACTERGIQISNTPGVIANATADVAMFLTLGALRYAMIPLEALLGIVGMGGIGQALARRARAFGMKIIYHNRTRLSEKDEGDATYMKDGVIIINTARGPPLDEEALVKGLHTGKVGSAGLDVYENEPKIHSELISNKKVMLLPHLGTTTVETKRKMELLAIRNLERAIDTGELLTLIRI
ncbi:glyoxylate/hydroxypyruvate reductase [Aspergillus cavernicola]|uniref:Glyoxylate/hydroxypyruvate reductase n=1 Tax=Aspergillus cavernicola TaxID=176166 RepID=A0ABR4J4K8_9EURO